MKLSIQNGQRYIDPCKFSQCRNYSAVTKLIWVHRKKFKKFPRNKEIDTDLQDDDQDTDRDTEEDADPTIVPRATYAKKSYQCMNCLTHNSVIWRRSPSDFDRKRKVFNKVLCNDCGVFWLKYAKTKPISSETRIANMASTSMHDDYEKKRKRTSETPTGIMKSISKRIKDEKAHHQSDILRFEPSPCQICSLSSPDTRLYTCHGCGMSVHNGKCDLNVRWI
jgi:DNA-directed RNA polymerase subunit RPC12/RpoP